MISNFVENLFKEAKDFKIFLEIDFNRLDSNQNISIVSDKLFFLYYKNSIFCLF
jgi:hypothetical protein